MNPRVLAPQILIQEAEMGPRGVHHRRVPEDPRGPGAQGLSDLPGSFTLEMLFIVRLRPVGTMDAWLVV